jgi:predicted MFS family arabinose efflux permease
MKINFPLMALAIGAFGIGVTEFSPMGMLPVIAGIWACRSQRQVCSLALMPLAY